MHVKFFIFLFLYPLAAFAQQYQLSGTVLTAESEVPFAHVYLEGTTQGTVSNENGKFSMRVRRGHHTLIVRAIGYESYRQEIHVQDDISDLFVVLEPAAVSLGEVVVSGDEDPAYEIMRQVIANREKHRTAVKGFSSKVYLKGLNRIVKAPDEVFGIPVNFLGVLDSNNTGIIYLSESESEFHFQYPDRVRETMYASRVSGNTLAFSWNMASDFLFSLYQNRISRDIIARRVIVSPLADNAFFYYRFRLRGITQEDGLMVYHIDFEPRRSNDPVMTGSLQINHDLWNLRQTNLYMFKENGLNFVDTLHIRQSFVPVTDDIWMPMTQHFEFDFELFGVQVQGYFTGVYSDYKLNPDFPDGFFSNEILKIEEGANELAESLWDNLRPIPLTEEELKDYVVKDSLQELRESKPFLDSIDREYNRFRLWSLLLGYRYRNSYEDRRYWTNPLISSVQFNTVEGLSIENGLRFRQSDENTLYHELEAQGRYGFSSRNFYGKLGYTRLYSRQTQGRFSVSGGHYIQQFNPREPVSPLVNTVYTLALRENYKKMYEKSFFSMRWQAEIFNGGMFSIQGGYERRNQLENQTDYTWHRNEEKVFSNNTIVPLQAEELFEDDDLFYLSTALRFRFRQTYITRPDRKIITGYKGPQLYLRNRTGFPAFRESATFFTRMEAELAQEFSLGLLGNAEYNLIGGHTFVFGDISAIDFKHFSGNQTLVTRYYDKAFFLLDYYAYSTPNTYGQLHFTHHFDGFIINKIPILRNTRMSFLYGLNLLAVDGLPIYTEAYIGLKNIFNLIRLDYAFGRAHGASLNHGIRFGLNLGGL